MPSVKGGRRFDLTGFNFDDRERENEDFQGFPLPAEVRSDGHHLLCIFVTNQNIMKNKQTNKQTTNKQT